MHLGEGTCLFSYMALMVNLGYIRHALYCFVGEQGIVRIAFMGRGSLLDPIDDPPSYRNYLERFIILFQ